MFPAHAFAHAIVLSLIAQEKIVDRGSVWRKWDLHVHTPATLMANEFGTWEEYLQALKGEKEVCAIGVTDYLSIEGYKRLLQEHATQSLGSIKLLIPNIEFRITPQTQKGHAINIHLLVDPSSAEHVAEIEAALGRLTVAYQQQNYSCTPKDIIRLGAAFDANASTDDQKLRVGTNQYKIEGPTFLKWLAGEAWLSANAIVAVSGGNDGPSGIKDDGWEASQEEIWRSAHIILTSNQGNRDFWLCRDVQKADGARKLGAPKPCVSSSDAHSMATLFKPAEDRFCWLKADPTFEGLKSILYEPAERVYVGKHAPMQHDMSRVITQITIEGSPNSGVGNLTIPLNSGLVTVIGAKGSGKSALADYIAYASGSMAVQERGSFISRAKNFVKGTKVTLLWGDAEPTTASIGDPLPKRELVRYLSQSFVEQLCSEDYAGASLAEEIEKVIFTHLDPKDTLNASSFSSLRSLRTRELSKERNDLNAKVRTLISEDEALRSSLKEIPQKKSRIEELAKEADSLQKQVPKAETAQEAEAQKNLSNRREQLLIQQSAVGNQKQLLLGVEDIQSSIVRFGNRVSDFSQELRERLHKVGVDPLKVNVKFEVSGVELIENRKEQLQEAISRMESGSGQQASSISELTNEIASLEQSVAKDQMQRNLIQQLQRRIAANMQETQRLQKEVVTSESEMTGRQDELRSERLETYKRMFALWTDEQRTLEQLYKPVQEKLKSGDDEEKQLDFYIRWNVNAESWLDRGQALFDQRKGHPFGSIGQLREYIDSGLVPAWQSGDPDAVKVAMDAFLSGLKKRNAEKFLKQSASHGMMLEWVFNSDHVTLAYGLRYNGVEIEKLSPGTKGIVLLILYLAMDLEDSRPLLVDQPEENLDNESIFSLLSVYFRKAKQRRQVLIITHNPNLVVNTDAEQVIVASAVRVKGAFPEFSYYGGALEDVSGIRKRVCNILEGGERAFLERERRYALKK